MNRSRVSLRRVVCLAAALVIVAVAIAPMSVQAAQATQANEATGAATGSVETLVFVRHGEKPTGGFGQLNCQGLNRSLALPAVIAAKFGKPDAIFAPNPGQEKDDNGQPYNYIRPLATIEPTAIQYQMPVQTPYGFRQIDKLSDTLLKPRYHDKLVVIAWEHRLIEKLVRQMVSAHGGAASDVPKWEGSDFDSIYIVKLDWQNASPHATFRHEQQGLDGRSAECPRASLPDAASGVAH
ncbi:histidine phosphatase family protein [Paraburkholderia sp.]|uniref:histidine phosphatase family protein n=1 Tax=Paraburkholderia sp. TaxID=1926495 RepID=UPI00238AD091|nr:histidine phosphatase family protein [Paraburkholderia sp.]MDE1181265.1 histidine phosphatase family protein [Paraburkholderia sp.]